MCFNSKHKEKNQKKLYLSPRIWTRRAWISSGKLFANWRNRNFMVWPWWSEDFEQKWLEQKQNRLCGICVWKSIHLVLYLSRSICLMIFCVTVSCCILILLNKWDLRRIQKISEKYKMREIIKCVTRKRYLLLSISRKMD